MLSSSQLSRTTAQTQAPDAPQTAPSAAEPGHFWDVMGLRLPLSQGLIMGILNVTPDSFSDGGRFHHPEDAVRHGLRMAEEGAAIFDVGGESTRPGALPVDEPEELRRVIPVIRGLIRERPGLVISIDTTKPAVARAALDAGARVINDITALASPEMAALAASSGAGVVLMHMKGTPRTMQLNPVYNDAPAEVATFLASRRNAALRHGIRPERIVLDPGIGFGKRLEDNLALLAATPRLASLGSPLLLGFSRKSFIARLLEEDPIEARFWPTVALCALSFRLGARIFRVHDVRPCLHAVRMAAAIAAHEKNLDPAAP